MNVRGARAIAALCLRCYAILVVVNVLAFLVIYAFGGARDTAVYYLVMGLLVACVPLWLVGWPIGILTAHLLAPSTREWVQVTVFALVGAVLSVTLFGMLNVLSVVPWFALVAAAEGAVGSGVARWWSGWALARRGTWSPEQGAALPWGKIGP